MNACRGGTGVSGSADKIYYMEYECPAAHADIGGYLSIVQ